MGNICDRFAGTEGRRRLIEAWKAQPFVGADDVLAGELAQQCAVTSFADGMAIFQQSANDTDLYLILVGSVNVEVNGRPSRVRQAGAYVGELAMIDIHERRSATIRAAGEVCVARLSEPQFAAIASQHPEMWRHFAIEIARRLRQRLDDIPGKNVKPVVFIGSSREALPIANEIEAAITTPDTEVRTWTNDAVFVPMKTAIEALDAAVRQSDFAILVFSPDDQLRSRGANHVVPRDNVIFELGLFMGALGRERAFIVMPRGGLPTAKEGWDRIFDAFRGRVPALKMPSDLLSLTPLTYDASGAPGDRIAAIAEQLKRIIALDGSR